MTTIASASQRAPHSIQPFGITHTCERLCVLASTADLILISTWKRKEGKRNLS